MEKIKNLKSKVSNGKIQATSDDLKVFDGKTIQFDIGNIRIEKFEPVSPGRLERPGTSN